MTRRPLIFAVAAGALGMFCTLALSQEKQPGEPTPPTSQPAPSGGTPRLDISSREWNFGEVWQGEPLKVDVTVKNTGDAPLTLDVKSSCGCTVPTKPKNPLAPGESDTMSISYDSIRRRGPAHQTVTITTNDPTQPTVTFSVKGSIMPVYELKPIESLSFGKLYRDSEESRTIEVVNKYTDKLDVKIKPDQNFGPYEIELKELETGQRYQVTARTRPPLEIGTARTTVVLDTGLKRLPEIEIIVYGAVQPAVSVSPNRLFLAKNSVSPMQQVLRLSFAPTSPVRVLEAKATHPSIKVEVREPKSEKVPPEIAKGEGQKPEAETTVQEIAVTLPPGSEIPDGIEPAIEIKTNSSDPSFEKLVVPIRIVAGRGADTAPGAAPTSRPAVGPTNPAPKQP